LKTFFYTQKQTSVASLCWLCDPQRCCRKWV